ncbi:MAG: pyruvate formate-lyase [Chloroflexi bacterium AL-W]|nr:pyruvate formate-lyase [Chloroflexi bacterium AL-N1]NOK66921.1 pyruvate formate-lyase [Chloroflexi bacterium AL-N10]NOK74787.1 pyruvate formate-lyase [Chloroflexi bacterium AL-N5]NOK81523.1 pyruvate formate-lyase [Chloroflexi bacterium AL-W]NOK88993.1 pyruvate formate-lyase [Chloroflexi bacterium AL-N15]
MRCTELTEHVTNGTWRCDVCQWGCQLADGDIGRCLVRTGNGQGITILNDGMISAAQVSPIEDHRIWHAFPNAPILAIGGWGYAFPVDQQRGPYGQIPTDDRKNRRLDPDRAAQFALEQLCRGVVWKYSDPSVSHEYVLELLKLSRASSRFTAIVTSGYLTISALDEIGHYLDIMNLDLRAFEDGAYHQLAGITNWRDILKTTAHAYQRWNCHIEVTTQLHPQINDTDEQLKAMSHWICSTLGPQTAWHVLPGDNGAAATASVVRARKLGHEAGLKFIYSGDPNQNTLCPSCGTVVIERNEKRSRIVGLENGQCTTCSEKLSIRTSIFKR